MDPESDEEEANEEDEDSEEDGAYAPSDDEIGSEEESDYSGESAVSESDDDNSEGLFVSNSFYNWENLKKNDEALILRTFQGE